MTTPSYPDSQPNVESFESKLQRAMARDPLAEIEQQYHDGWPQRWPNSIASTAPNDDAN
jgi:hypothetical protein